MKPFYIFINIIILFNWPYEYKHCNYKYIWYLKFVYDFKMSNSIFFIPLENTSLLGTIEINKLIFLNTTS
jgi:hypothetical protein